MIVGVGACGCDEMRQRTIENVRQIENIGVQFLKPSCSEARNLQLNKVQTNKRSLLQRHSGRFFRKIRKLNKSKINKSNTSFIIFFLTLNFKLLRNSHNLSSLIPLDSKS